MIQLSWTIFSSKYRISGLFSCYWKCCKSLPAVHVSGVCMCVTADHNQYMFDREHLSHCKNPISCFWESLNKNHNCFFLPPPPCIAVYQAPMQNVTCTRLVSRRPSVHDCTAPSKVAAVFAWGFAEFPGRLLKATVENQHQNICRGWRRAAEWQQNQAQMMGRCSSSRGRCCHDNRSVLLTLASNHRILDFHRLT